MGSKLDFLEVDKKLKKNEEKYIKLLSKRARLLTIKHFSPVALKHLVQLTRKLFQVAADVLEWNMEEMRLAMEGTLMFAEPFQGPTEEEDGLLKAVTAVLVTLGKPTESYQPEGDAQSSNIAKNGIKKAALLLVKDHTGKFSLIRDPLYLDKCIVSKNFGKQEEAFEIQEVVSKNTYIFKAETVEETKKWFQQLQYHAQGLGAWRQRRNALPNIALNGQHLRS